jgi:hypothetical protein
MINENHNACRRAEDLVSYLYGEISRAEKTRFEAHLLDCGACAEEISSFGALRSSIIDWRERDFAPLETPPIRLPETEKSFPAAVETASVSISWLAGLRQMFSLSPAWTGATAAMAALVICAGLFYVAVSSLQSGGETEVSEVNRNSSVTRSAVPTPTAPTNGTPQIAGKDAEKPVESSKPPAAGNPKSANQTANRKSATTVFERATETVKTDETPKTPKKPTANRAPRRADVQLITDKDEDDETLRLTDLFDEIGER